MDMVNDITKALVEIYSVEGVADRLSVTVNTIYRWLRGKSRPRPKQEDLLRKLYDEHRESNNQINQ